MPWHKNILEKETSGSIIRRCGAGRVQQKRGEPPQGWTKT